MNWPARNTLAQLLALYTDSGGLRKYKHIKATQYKTPWNTFRGHSRSLVLGSLKSRRGTTYYCIIMCTLESEILKERSEHLGFWETHCHSAPHIWGTPANIRLSVIFLETRNIYDLSTFCCWQFVSIFIHIFLVGSKKLFHFCKSDVLAVQTSRSSKVIDICANRKRVRYPISLS